MKLVILETPFRGLTKSQEKAHVHYARLCTRDSLSRGEAPLVSHLLYTQPGILDDALPRERELGISAGHAWMRHADLVAVYTDFGVSSGMRAGIRVAKNLGIPVEVRVYPDKELVNLLIEKSKG